MSAVEIRDWIDRSRELLARVAVTVEGAPSERVRLLADRLPASVTPDDGAVSVVFAGQYGAGKSSILKVLTGREDVAIGAGITTGEVCEYDWSGIRVVDTPGIHTELRPDHDAAAYEAVVAADLLVFVVTNELFDSHLAGHFRKLAVERDKAHELMLVVNKMRRCAGGNTIAAQNVIREDLRRVLVPFSPEQLRTAFLDAETVIEAGSEADPDVASVLRRKSGFTAFTDGLNDFVRELGLAGRYTTALYSVEQVLQEALSAAKPASDRDAETLIELLLQRRRALLDTRDRLRQAVESRVERASADIRKDGREVADALHARSDPEEIDRKLRDAQARVRLCAKRLADTVQETVEREMALLDERVGRIMGSVVAKELFSRLDVRVEIELAGLEAGSETLGKVRNASKMVTRLGEFLLRHSFDAKKASFSGLFKPGRYSGTAAHEAIKKIGHLFGKQFQPWEAVKWTKYVSHTARVLVVSGTVLTIALQYKEDADAAKLERELREGRSSVRAGFGDAAEAVESHFDRVLGDCISRTIGRWLQEVDEQLADLREMQRTRGALFEALTRALADVQALIREMHSGSSHPA